MIMKRSCGLPTRPRNSISLGVPSEADPLSRRLAAHPEQHSLRHGCPVADATPDGDTGPNASVASPSRPVTGYPGAGSPDEVPTNLVCTATTGITFCSHPPRSPRWADQVRLPGTLRLCVAGQVLAEGGEKA